MRENADRSGGTAKPYGSMKLKIEKCNFVHPSLKRHMPDLALGLGALERDHTYRLISLGQIRQLREIDRPGRQPDPGASKFAGLIATGPAKPSPAPAAAWPKTKIRISDEADRQITRICQATGHHYYMVLNAALLVVSYDRVAPTYQDRDQQLHLRLASLMDDPVQSGPGTARAV